MLLQRQRPLASLWQWQLPLVSLWPPLPLALPRLWLAPPPHLWLPQW
ncbi:hypothetical protein ACLBYD_06540 [Rhodococcus sp. C26F]